MPGVPAHSSAGQAVGVRLPLDHGVQLGLGTSQGETGYRCLEGFKVFLVDIGECSAASVQPLEDDQHVVLEIVRAQDVDQPEQVGAGTVDGRRGEQQHLIRQVVQ
ncbi:hypothetical protein D3C80_1737290 [compost metagenome]